MRNIVVGAFICFWGIVACYGQPTLTPKQQQLTETYKSNQDSPIDIDADSYTSPDIYDENTNEEEDVDKHELDGEVGKKTAPAGSGLKIFGHDIFDGSGQVFDPDLIALPPADYTLSPGDNLIVNVWGRVELSLNLTVDREGKVFIPKVGEIIAVGNTFEQFKQKLNNKLSKLYSDYQISAALGKLRQIRIYVFGEVIRPGGYSLSSLATLLHALYTAGGITHKGSMRNIQLIRNTRIFNKHDLYDLLLKGDTSGDLKLLSGDVVYVPVAGPLVSVSGEVRRPAIYELSANERLSDLIQLAGGANPTALLESISLDRIGPNDFRILKDLNLSDSTNIDANNILLKDGDKINVLSMYDYHTNLVQLEGYVKHPGAYGLTDSMRVSDLIGNGEQLIENTYLSRADLFRRHYDGKKELIPVNLKEIIEGNSNHDYYLQSADRLVVYSNDQITRTKHINIKGEIRNPGKYALYDNMKLSDLIFLAGNLTKQAYLVQCEIARVNPGHLPDIIVVNLEDIYINNNQDADIAIQEDDCVFVRQIPDWKPVQIVTIEGEVQFPGKYAIHHKNEKLSDLIKRAGGLTPTAFPEGASFNRQSIESDISRRNIGQIINNTQEVRLDSMGHTITDTRVLFDPEQLNRIIIDLPELYKKPGSPSDIVLMDADYVYIPAVPTGVQVVGAVAANGTISFRKGKKAKHYIAQAGGLTPDGDESGLRLVRPNGKVYYGRKGRSRKVELGDVIIVPSKIKQKTNWGKIISTTATVIGSMATTIFIVDRLK